VAVEVIARLKPELVLRGIEMQTHGLETARRTQAHDHGQVKRRRPRGKTDEEEMGKD